VSYYKAEYSILKKTSKYKVYKSHFENLPVYDVDFEWKNDNDDTVIFLLFSDTIDAMDDAMIWIEKTLGLEPYKVQWVEDKNT
jgi:hypothetical protein